MKKIFKKNMIIRISNNAQGSLNDVGHLHLYVPQEYSEIVKKAKKIARREGRSISKLVMDLLRDYVRVHEPGNPQLPLTRFTEDMKDSKICSFEGCDAPAGYVVHLEGRSIRVCMKHLKVLRRKHGALGYRRL